MPGPKAIECCEAKRLFIDLPRDPATGGRILGAFCRPTSVSAPVAHQLVNERMPAFLETSLAGERPYQNTPAPGWAMCEEQVIACFVTEKRDPHAIDEDCPGLFFYVAHRTGTEQTRGPKEPKGPAVARVGLVR